MEDAKQGRLAERVRELWSTRPAEQMKLFRTLRAEGYRPSEIMLEVQALRSGGVGKEKKGAVINPLFIDCPRNDAGEVVDPFTLTSIEPEDLVSYETPEGQRFCFDRKSLYRQYLVSERTPLQNPFTRKVLPSLLQQEVVAYGESLRTTIEIDEQIFVVEPFISIGELVVSYFVSLGANYLDLLSETNLLYEGYSLYAGDLKAEAQSLEGEISAQLFTSQAERDLFLTTLFQFVSALRARPLYDTIYLHLGELLAVVPLVPREDGFDLTLHREMTVLDVVRAFYTALQAKFGGNVWREYDIVTEAGDSLSDFNFYESVLSELPGENLHYVAYLTDEEARTGVEEYLVEAFYTNDQELLSTINAGYETNFNWTITEFFTLMTNLFDNFDVKDETLREKVAVLTSVLERIDYERYEVQDLVTSLIKHVLAKKKAVFLQPLLVLLRRINDYDERHALFQFELAKMRKKQRLFIAERLAGEAGRDLIVNFYKGKPALVTDLTVALQLDDVPLFNSLFSRAKGLLHDYQLREICNRIEKSHVKLYQVLLLEIKPKYSWQALFGQLSWRKYESILNKVTSDAIHEGIGNPRWLATKTERKHFLTCLRDLVSYVNDEYFPLINWNMCYQIFYIEGVAEAMPQPMTVAYKVCAEDPALTAVFVPLLDENEQRWLLARYPSAPGFERALAMKASVFLPLPGSDERVNLVREVCRGDYELLLALLIRRGEDAPTAVEIILEEVLFIVRKTASYLLAGCSYADCLPLLEKYYDEQIAFGVLPQKYFQQYLHKY